MNNFGMREMIGMMQEAFNDVEYEMLNKQGLIKHYNPSSEQELLMNRITKLSGIVFKNDLKEAYRFVGRKVLSSHGMFWLRPNGNRKGQITMNLEPTDPYWYSVLAHELSHATGLLVWARPAIVIPNSQLNPMFFIYEELLAETSAYLVLNKLGLSTPDTIKRNNEYISNFLKGAEKIGKPLDNRTMVALREEANIVSDYVVNNWLVDLKKKEEPELMDIVKKANNYF